MEHNNGREHQREAIFAAAECIDQAAIAEHAQWLIANRELVPTAPVRMQERRDNARTAQMEVLTASGHLSVVEITDESVEAIHQQVMDRLLNGYLQATHPHEKQRNFAEICNELTIHWTHLGVDNGVVEPTTEVLEISDYPESLIDDEANRLGYRAANKKGMLRSSGLRKNPDGTYTRVIEQISRSNGTEATTGNLMRDAGVQVAVTKPHDIAVLEKPLVYSRRQLADGVVAVMRRLDGYGLGLRYGDTDHSKHVTYDILRAESMRREQDIEHSLHHLAQLELQLDAKRDAGVITQAERDQIYGQQIEQSVSAICALNPEYAEDAYGKSAAVYFHTAALMIAQGNIEQAQAMLEQANLVKNEIIFCGMKIAVEEAQKMGLDVKNFSSMVSEGKENWKWKEGICRVDNCPTRPGKTKVGPCSVCKDCQSKFDAGQDPTKDIAGLISELFKATLKPTHAKNSEAGVK